MISLQDLNRGKWDQRRINRFKHLLTEKDGHYYYNNQRIIRKDEIVAILTEMLKDPVNVGGRDYLYQAVLRKGFIGISRRSVMDYLRNLEAYQLIQPLQRSSTLRPIVTNGPNYVWQIDLIDMQNLSHYNQGYNYILVMIDLFSKYVFAIPIKTKSAEDVADAMTFILDKLDPNQQPSAIQSDNGPEFKNDLIRDTLKDINIKQIFSKPYTPQSQGIVERFNKTLKQRLLLIMTQNSNKKWLLSLESVLLGYNNSKHSSTGFAPEYLCFNSSLRSADEIKTAHQRLKARAAKSINPKPLPPIAVGDFVRISHTTSSTFARKNLLVRKGTRINWSKELWTVTNISAPKQIYLTELYRVESPSGIVYNLTRAHLQPVNLAKLVSVNNSRLHHNANSLLPPVPPVRSNN